MAVLILNVRVDTFCVIQNVKYLTVILKIHNYHFLHFIVENHN